MRKARIKISGPDPKILDNLGWDIKNMSKKVGAKVSGPIPLPTKRLKITTLTSPDGEGTQRWDRWEKRIHKRIVDVSLDERVMRHIMRLQVPAHVHVEIEIVA
ncbi:MAG: 30S ribosomal protein S10 [Candidatus Altiarchaeota archaeon]|nr:30S ribosomal protein S10 [Candidatus Altiarchaeota archaeon]